MMDYTDYMNNWQTGYSNFMNNPVSAMQPMMNAVSSMMGSPATTAPAPPHHHHHHRHGCGCHEHDDCACSCCIRCADVIEYARCGEERRIPLSFDNDTRRERDVTLQLGNFATESGLDLGWKAAVTPAAFKLAPCGETTVVLSVAVDCGKLGTTTTGPDGQRIPGPIDGCKVAYATLRAEGCSVRPLVIAVAVLPDFCGAHRTCCSCGCCHCNCN